MLVKPFPTHEIERRESEGKIIDRSNTFLHWHLGGDHAHHPAKHQTQSNCCSEFNW